MKRLFVVLTLASGLLAAGGANAADLGNFSADCTNVNQTAQAFSATVGDTFTMTPNGTCRINVFSGSSAILPNSGTISSPTVFQLTQPQFVYLQLNNAPPNAFTWFSITVNPTPAPIPTLSEWGQIILMFMMIASVGFYGWRMKQH